ncbi:hypothetical protein AAHC03_012859 [Spirometra sp. Aus1]
MLADASAPVSAANAGSSPQTGLLHVSVFAQTTKTNLVDSVTTGQTSLTSGAASSQLTTPATLLPSMAATLCTEDGPFKAPAASLRIAVS